jgi:hypothetical protein
MIFSKVKNQWRSRVNNIFSILQGFTRMWALVPDIEYKARRRALLPPILITFKDLAWPGSDHSPTLVRS